MNNKKTGAQPAKEVTGAQDAKAQQTAENEVKNLIKGAGLQTETQQKALPEPKPEPLKKKVSLAEREKSIRENADRLKGLTTLRKELDQLRSWGFADNGNKAKLTISGDEVFEITNTRLISTLKTNLEDLFEERIKELETEIENAEI